MADEALPVADVQFKKMTTMIGEWKTQDHPALRIIFEPTAGSGVIVERWMVGEHMHSMTVYHLDGDVSEDEADLDWPVWAGVVPYKQKLAQPVRATGVRDQFDAPILIRPV